MGTATRMTRARAPAKNAFTEPPSTAPGHLENGAANKQRVGSSFGGCLITNILSIRKKRKKEIQTLYLSSKKINGRFSLAASLFDDSILPTPHFSSLLPSPSSRRRSGSFPTRSSPPQQASSTPVSRSSHSTLLFFTFVKSTSPVTMCLCVGLSSFFLLLPFYFLLRLGSQPEIQQFALS